MAKIAPTFTINHTMTQRMVTKHTLEESVGTFEQRAASGERVEVLDEIVYGPFVEQKQRITNNGTSQVAMWIYEVADGKVVNLWRFDAAGLLSARTADK